MCERSFPSRFLYTSKGIACLLVIRIILVKGACGAPYVFVLYPSMAYLFFIPGVKHKNDIWKMKKNDYILYYVLFFSFIPLKGKK